MVMQGPGRQMPAGGFGMMGVMMVLWLLMMAPMIIGWIIVIIALWRGMKAHERIATTLTTLTGTLPGRRAGSEEPVPP